MKKNKGFTLIELLAVIVILAILLAIAVPKVTQYITKSRKDSMTTTLADYVDAVRRDVTSEMFDLPLGDDDVTIVSTDMIKLERGKKKSPFSGVWLDKYSYVAIINIGTGEDPEYSYYVAAIDSKRYGVALTLEENISRDSIIRNNTAGTKIKITSMCGTKDGEYKIINSILGLESHQPVNGWNAVIYSNSGC